MLSQSDIERERCESRRKAQLDYDSGLRAARMEGREEGRKEAREAARVEGEKLGVIWGIHGFERLLNRPETSAEQLTSLSLNELIRLLEDLAGQLQKR